MRIKIDGTKRDILAVCWKNNIVEMIDQRWLPFRFQIKQLHSWQETTQAIKDLVTRGAGSVGVAGAFAIAQAANELDAVSVKEFLNKLTEIGTLIAQTRPTAVTLSAAVNYCLQMATKGSTINEIRHYVLLTAQQILESDIQASKAIGENGAKLLRTGSRVLTHCNTGALGIQDSGSALGVIRCAYAKGKLAMVYVSETRPWLQGSRLTTWELQQEDIPHQVLVDSACGYLFSRDLVDAVIVGADRIALNGDVANKIGTYEKAVLAHIHKIPFYVAAPVFTFDLTCPNGQSIDIEERPSKEVQTVVGRLPNGEIGPVQIAPDNTNALNPVFDITPNKYVTGFITEDGILTKINAKNIQKLLAQSGIKNQEKGI